jgi:hypothetical protein
MKPPTIPTTDPSLELRDIKPAIEIPNPASWPLWVTLTLIALAIAVAAFAWWQWRRRQKNTRAPSLEKIALAELGATQAMITDADPAAYAMAVSDVLRRHVERVFNITAVRHTTEEFLRDLAADQRIGTEHRNVLCSFLNQCDLVKFACGELDLAQRQALHDVARSFIQTSYQEPEPVVITATPQPTY